MSLPFSIYVFPFFCASCLCMSLRYVDGVDRNIQCHPPPTHLFLCFYLVNFLNFQFNLLMLNALISLSIDSVKMSDDN